MSSNMTAIMEMDPFVLTRSTGAIVVPLLAIVALLLDIPCFAWHLKNRNLPASCLVFWIILANLFNFINALVWPTDDIPNWYQGQGYCDLEVKLDIAATFGIPAAVICVMKSLAQALNTDKIVLHPSASQRRRKIIIECLLCFGLPAYVIAIHYVVQPTRYYIFAIAGCTPSFDNSWPSIALVYIWPMALCLVGGYYASE